MPSVIYIGLSLTYSSTWCSIFSNFLSIHLFHFHCVSLTYKSLSASKPFSLFSVSSRFSLLCPPSHFLMCTFPPFPLSSASTSLTIPFWLFFCPFPKDLIPDIDNHHSHIYFRCSLVFSFHCGALSFLIILFSLPFTLSFFIPYIFYNIIIFLTPKMVEFIFYFLTKLEMFLSPWLIPSYWLYM